MPLLTIVPPMPGAERRFKPFTDFVHTCGWETEFVRLDWPGHRPPFGSTEIFPQVDAQTAGKVVMGYSLGALYAHLGALRARHLILGSISPFFLEDEDEPERWMISYRNGNAATPADVLVGALEDEQMHRRATAVRDFYHQQTYTAVPAAEHELWHPNYLQEIKSALDRLGASRSKVESSSLKPQDSSLFLPEKCKVQSSPLSAGPLLAGPSELYHLADDLSERTTAEPERVKTMTARLRSVREKLP